MRPANNFDVRFFSDLCIFHNTSQGAKQL